MSKKLLTVILPSVIFAGFFAMNVQAHDGSDSGSHYVVDGSGNPVKSSSGCVTSSGSGSGSSEACGDGAMAKAAMAPVMAPAAAVPAIDSQVQNVVVPAAPAPVMMQPVKVMGAGHSHPANHCTNSITHTHARAGSGGHTHHYSCQRNAPKRMASPRQMAAPRQKAHY